MRRLSERGQVTHGFARPYQPTFIGLILAIILLILGVLMWSGSFTATPEHVGLLFVLTALAILL